MVTDYLGNLATKLLVQKYIFLYPSGGKREHVNKVRQPVKVEPKKIPY